MHKESCRERNKLQTKAVPNVVASLDRLAWDGQNRKNQEVRSI
jgi:hypothetical protein